MKIMQERIFCSVTPANEFAQKVAQFSGVQDDIDSSFEPEVYSGGEFCPRFTVAVKGKDVYIIANPDAEITPQDMVMRICLTADAARENGARNVILIQMDLFYSRQDRAPTEDIKFQGQPYSVFLQAKLFHASGITKVLTVHLHSKKCYEAYGLAYFGKEDEEAGRKVLFHLDPNPVLAHYLLFHSSLEIKDGGKNVVFIAPDEGATMNSDRLHALCFLPHAAVAYCKKIRISPNNPEDVDVELASASKNFSGIEGKSIIIADDIVDTGGTITKTMHGLLKKEHAPKQLFLCFTHPVLAGKNWQQVQKKITSARPTEIITFNTHPAIETQRIPEWKKNSTVLRIAWWVSDVLVHCMEKGASLQEYYTVSSKEELDKKFSRLYDIKRSTMHFLEQRSPSSFS